MMIKNTLRFSFLLLSLLFPLQGFTKDAYPRNPDLDIIHYRFHIYLNDSTDRIAGSTDITFKLVKKTRSIMLDLTGINEKGKGMVVDQVTAGSHPLVYRHENSKIEINLPDTLTEPGNHSMTISYSGIPADGLIISKNKFGDRTFFGDNWPDRGRNWLPCVDHPSDKATSEFIVSAPEKYKVVSNGLEIAGYPVISVQGTHNWVSHWKEEVPIPTKVMVIGVADFAWETVGYSKGIPVQTWVYAQNREAGFIDYQPALDITTYYQNLIGPLSYEKLANVQSKTMFGGMENSGCIFYYEGSVTGKNKLQSLLAHEIAHQWFGDAVTENDWHHIWISEGFATYLEAVYADSMLPNRKLDATMADMRKSVIRYSEKNKKPVIDTTIVNNMELLSTNSYQKGAWVLHLLRQEVGDEAFWNGIRKFYATYRDKNALSADFQEIMQSVSGKPLGEFFHQWLEIAGQPSIEWSWKYNKRKKSIEIDIRQTQEQHVFKFKLPVEVISTSGNELSSEPWNTVYYEVPVNEKTVHISLPGEYNVTEVRLDPKVQLLFQEKLLKK